MTRNDLFLCMDAVDDDVLARSDKTTRVETRQKRRNGWWIAAAACFCLIAGFGVWGLFGGANRTPTVPNDSTSLAGNPSDIAKTGSLILDGKQDACYVQLTYQDYIRFGLLPEETPHASADALNAMCSVYAGDIGAALGTVTTSGNPELVGKTAYVYNTASGDDVCIVESDEGYEFFYKRAVLLQENAVAAYELLDRAFGHDDIGYTLFPDDYAGAYVEGDKLVLLLTDIGEEAQERYKSWAAEYADALVFRKAEYSYNALNDAETRMLRDLEEAGYTMGEAYLSETANRIVISLMDVTYEQAKELEQSLRESYDLPVTITVSQGGWNTTTTP